MTKITTIGLDLAKNTFHVVCCNQHGKLIKKKQLTRKKLLTYLANLPGCLMGMEACSSAHYWARQLTGLGHQVRVIAPWHVKAYRRGNKTDYNAALAIAEAVVRPQMRFVLIKSQTQQDLQSVNNQRQQFIAGRTQQANRIRALLVERGVSIARGLASLRREVSALLGTNSPGLSEIPLALLADGYEHFQQLDEHVSQCEQLLD